MVEATKEEIEGRNSNEVGPEDVILQIKGLKTYFYTEEGVVKAVDGVSFNIYENETIGLVGETGCGKSVTALTILRLVRAPGKILGGKIKFKGIDFLKLSKKEMRNYRGKDITMIFQDPLNSLNPVITIGKQLSEVFFLHQKENLKTILDQLRVKRKERQAEKKELKKELKENDERLSEIEKEELNEKIQKLQEATKGDLSLKKVALKESEKMIKAVGIPDAKGILNRYPHELSGGMRQRVMIAMALSCSPSLLIADEPTTALDVTIQAQILELMKKLKTDFNTSILMITHDLGIIAEICDRVMVMYSGSIVELADAEGLFKRPLHPYTKGLIGAIPSIEKRDQKLKTIRGSVPNLIYPPSGCRFHPRCPNRLEICEKIKPSLNEDHENHYIACHLFDAQYKDSPKYQWDEKEQMNSILL